MTTEERLTHEMIADAIARCRVPESSESRESKFFTALRTANEQLDAVARAQRAERERDAAIDARDEARLDADMFCEQRDELRVRVDELEAEIRELKGESK